MWAVGSESLLDSPTRALCSRRLGRGELGPRVRSPCHCRWESADTKLQVTSDRPRGLLTVHVRVQARSEQQVPMIHSVEPYGSTGATMSGQRVPVRLDAATPLQCGGP